MQRSWVRVCLLHFSHREQFTEIFRCRHYLAPKMSGKMAVKQTRNVSANCRQEPAHNAIWPKSFRKLKTVYIHIFLAYLILLQIIIIYCHIFASSLLLDYYYYWHIFDSSPLLSSLRLLLLLSFFCIISSLRLLLLSYFCIISSLRLLFLLAYFCLLHYYFIWHIFAVSLLLLQIIIIYCYIFASLFSQIINIIGIYLPPLISSLRLLLLAYLCLISTIRLLLQAYFASSLFSDYYYYCYYYYYMHIIVCRLCCDTYWPEQCLKRDSVRAASGQPWQELHLRTRSSSRQAIPLIFNGPPW